MKYKFEETEDEKYGGLEANNLKEAMDYFQMEQIIEIKSKTDEDLNDKLESDHHNTVRVNGKNMIRAIKMPNRDWHKLNQIIK